MKKHTTSYRKTPVIFLYLIAASCLFQSCLEKDLYQEPELPKATDYFDYYTNMSCRAMIDYGFKGNIIVFELFDENPFSISTDGTEIKTEKEPLYRGSTDKSGRFEEEISLPNYLTEVYLYSDFIGTIGPVRLSVIDGKISFDQKAFIAAQQQANIGQTTTRGTTTTGYTYPDGMKVLGNWAASGRPEYLSQLPIADIDSKLLYNIQQVFIAPGGAANMSKLHPEYINDSQHIEINIVKPTKISLVLLHSTATMKNSVGYFTYKTSEKPTSTTQIAPVIAFPHISTYICNSPGNNASMYTGDRVELKYWDGEKYLDEFPAGISIGWFMIQSCYANGNISKNAKRFYSIRDFNSNAEPRSIALKNKQDGKVVAIGFEDANFNTEPGGSRNGNFGDAVFYLDFGDGEAIETGGVPDLPETDIKEEDIHYSASGVLAFEDNWPNKGDYDMNDVIVSYRREIYKSVLTQKVTKLVDTFIAEHNGGLQANGFGYQLTGISSSTIRHISIEAEGVGSKFMNGQTQEPGQNYPTLVLFDDIRAALHKHIKVSIDLAPETYSEKDVTPFFTNPYWNQQYKYNFNPFVIIESNKGRGREAHIVKFPPTGKVDPAYFGTQQDQSQPATGLYYVNSDNLPTGLHLSGVATGEERGKHFIIPVEKVSILDTYPDFSAWASSFGTTNIDWWKKPKK